MTDEFTRHIECGCKVEAVISASTNSVITSWLYCPECRKTVQQSACFEELVEYTSKEVI